MSVNSTETPSILNYSDYRDFLAARFRYLKTIKKNFSHAIAARKTDVAQSYYKNIFRKDRHLGLESLGKVAKVLELNVTEEMYILFKLVSLLTGDSQVSEICDKNLKALLSELKFQKKGDMVVSNDHREVEENLQALYFYVILYLCDWPDFTPTVSWVKDRLFINDLSDEDLSRHIVKAKELYDSLKKQNISIDNLRISPLAAGQVIRTKQLFHAILPELMNINDYHAKVHNYAEHRHIINISPEGLKEVVELFNETREKLIQIQKKYASSPTTRTLFWAHSVYNLAREKDPSAIV